MKTLLEYLKLVKAEPKIGPVRYIGICRVLSVLTWRDIDTSTHVTRTVGERTRSIYQDQLVNLMTKWPAFSGNLDYPVPAKCPEDAFCYASQKGTLWLHEYGQRRLELLDWLIAELEKQNAAHGPETNS